MTVTLEHALRVILTTPAEQLAHDPALRERVERAQELSLALAKQPRDDAECERLANRLLQACGAHPGTGGKRPS